MEQVDVFLCVPLTSRVEVYMLGVFAADHAVLHPSPPVSLHSGQTYTQLHVYSV